MIHRSKYKQIITDEEIIFFNVKLDLIFFETFHLYDFKWLVVFKKYSLWNVKHNYSEKIKCSTWHHWRCQLPTLLAWSSKPCLRKMQAVYILVAFYLASSPYYGLVIPPRSSYPSKISCFFAMITLFYNKVTKFWNFLIEKKIKKIHE